LRKTQLEELAQGAPRSPAVSRNRYNVVWQKG
jgi:hypothetical protein